jgi:hypothetical protein
MGKCCSCFDDEGGAQYQHLTDMKYRHEYYKTVYNDTKDLYHVGNYIQIYGKPLKHHTDSLCFIYREAIEREYINTLPYKITQILEYKSRTVYVINMYGMEYAYYEISHPFNGYHGYVTKTSHV